MSGSWPIIATTVTRSGVYAANQADRSSSAVPVLPAAGWPAARAAVPVPSSTTLTSMEVVVSAASRLMACSGVRSGRRMVSSPLVIFSRKVYGVRRPWSARVAYAWVMSRTLACMVPSAMAGLATKFGVFSGMPRLIVVCLTLLTPTSTTIWAKTALTERSVAVLTVMSP